MEFSSAAQVKLKLLQTEDEINRRLVSSYDWTGGVFFYLYIPCYSGMFSLWMLGVKTSNLNIILSLAGVSAKPQGVPLVTILIFTVGSSLCLKLMILSSFQDLLVQPPRSDFTEFWRKKVAELNFNLRWKLHIATPRHSTPGPEGVAIVPMGKMMVEEPGPVWCWTILGMSTLRETTGRAWLSQSPMNTILMENEKNVPLT